MPRSLGFIVLFLTKLTQMHLHQIILLDLTKWMYTSKINISIGDPPENKQLSIDLTAQKNSLLNNSASPKLSKTLKVLNESIMKVFYKSILNEEIEEVFVFQSDPNQKCKLHFNLISDDHIYAFKEALALPSHFIQPEHSLIHYYKQNGLIQTLSFAFLFDIGLGQLSLGGIPEHRIKNRYHSTCSVLGHSNHWDCHMSSILLNMPGKELTFNTEITSDYIYFDSCKEFIRVPTSFFEVLIAFYEEAINTTNCTIKGLTNSRKVFCSGIPFFKNETITFFIGNYKYLIDIHSLFECDKKNYCILMIEENESEALWVFGSFFLRLYHILFDYDHKQVNFYSERGVEYVSSGAFRIKRVLLIIESLLILTGVLLVGLNKGIDLRRLKAYR